jgi:hypothetical protein
MSARDEEDRKWIENQEELLKNNPILRLKRYILFETDHKFVELGIKLRQDGIKSPRQFFIGLLIAYLDGDEDLEKVVQKIKKSYMNKYRRDKKVVWNLMKKGKFEEKLFGLDESDLEDIYSVIEADSEL